jgi:23S rRNA (cytosine1962-C5)-methyltransferase
MYPKVYLKKEEFLHRKHPWIFSGALEKLNNQWHNSPVYVCNQKGQVVATGYYQNSSIAIKILSFKEEIINLDFWIKKIENAYHYRQHINAFNSTTNAYRLIFAEADEIPGLIIDNYNGYFVFQAHTEFIYQQKAQIIQALQYVFKEQYKSIYDVSEWCKDQENQDNIPNDTTILENGLQFYVNWKEGQKTGFFLDQKNNRQCLRMQSSIKYICIFRRIFGLCSSRTMQRSTFCR